jgi:hypothetical protein
VTPLTFGAANIGSIVSRKAAALVRQAKMVYTLKYLILFA